MTFQDVRNQGRKNKELLASQSVTSGDIGGRQVGQSWSKQATKSNYDCRRFSFTDGEGRGGGCRAAGAAQQLLWASWAGRGSRSRVAGRWEARRSRGRPGCPPWSVMAFGGHLHSCLCLLLHLPADACCGCGSLSARPRLEESLPHTCAPAPICQTLHTLAGKRALAARTQTALSNRQFAPIAASPPAHAHVPP